MIALALFPSVVAHPANAFPGDLGDPPSQAWILAWDVHALRTNPAHLYNANIFYPEPGTFAYSDTIFLLDGVAAPFLWAGVNKVLVYNVLLIGGFVTSGLALAGARRLRP